MASLIAAGSGVLSMVKLSSDALCSWFSGKKLYGIAGTDLPQRVTAAVQEKFEALQKKHPLNSPVSIASIDRHELLRLSTLALGSSSLGSPMTILVGDRLAAIDSDAACLWMKAAYGQLKSNHNFVDFMLRCTETALYLGAFAFAPTGTSALMMAVNFVFHKYERSRSLALHDHSLVLQEATYNELIGGIRLIEALKIIYDEMLEKEPAEDRWWVAFFLALVANLGHVSDAIAEPEQVLLAEVQRRNRSELLGRSFDIEAIKKDRKVVQLTQWFRFLLNNKKDLHSKEFAQEADRELNKIRTFYEAPKGAAASSFSFSKGCVVQ